MEGIDLGVAAGERVAVVGVNGAGKSTLLRLLATALSPTGGEIRWFGASRPPRGSELPALRRRIAMAPDVPVFAGALTGREHLGAFQAFRGRGPGHVERWIDAFGLSDVADRSVESYSSGMRRRLVLAEAFGSAAGLLVLDEPTVGLDHSGVTALEEAAREEAGAGTAIVVATHDLARLAPGFDRVVVLHRGRVLADAPPSGLLERMHGRTRVFVTLAEGVEEPGWERGIDLPGVTLEKRRADGSLEFRTDPGGVPLETVLPGLLARLLESGVAVAEVRVREAGLEAVLEDMTGVTGPVPGRGSPDPTEDGHGAGGGAP